MFKPSPQTLPTMPPSADDRPSDVPWPPILFAGVVLFALALEVLLIRLPVPFAETRTLHIAGLILLAAGIGIALWAVLTFYRHGTTIRPDRGGDALIRAGPYAFSRNPMYLGEVLALVGAGIATNRLWFIVLAPLFMIAVTRLAIEREEAYLERRFGAAYLDYKDCTHRWL